MNPAHERVEGKDWCAISNGEPIWFRHEEDARQFARSEANRQLIDWHVYHDPDADESCFCENPVFSYKPGYILFIPAREIRGK